MLLESQGADSKFSLPRSICHSKEHLEWQKSRKSRLLGTRVVNDNYRPKHDMVGTPQIANFDL